MGIEPADIAADIGFVTGLSCRSYDHDGIAVVAATGEIDLATASSFRSALIGAVADSTGDLVVDLSEVTFMDSTGLGALVSARRRLALRGASLRLVGPTGGVRRILDIAKVEHVFPIHESLEEVAPSSA